ncbi:MAG TPA: histidine kinase, partial [Chitinophagaceae bacterium]|nr:histidine kinase [Chitinophagaceae bacterium]
MEYDNDRLIKKRYRIEIIYWMLLVLINPVINALNIFFTDWRIWFVLLLVNLVLLPLYLLSAEWVLPKTLLQKRTVYFFAASIACFLAVHLMLYVVYAIVLQFSLSPYEKNYFEYSSNTFLRESVWAIVNMLFAAGIYFIKTAFDEKEMLQALQKENNFYKLRYLRAQLNPHFLFNTLNSIYSLSLQKSDKAPEAVIRLADVMRYLIYECNEDKIPLDKEIEFIRNYIAIEQIRFNADIKLAVEGQTEGVMIEPFLFISFIENGFKHALDNTDVQPFIYITVKVKPKE